MATGGIAFWKAETKRLEKFMKEKDTKGGTKDGASLQVSLAKTFRDLSKMAIATERAEDGAAGGGRAGGSRGAEMEALYGVGDG